MASTDDQQRKRENISLDNNKDVIIIDSRSSSSSGSSYEMMITTTTGSNETGHQQRDEEEDEDEAEVYEDPEAAAESEALDARYRKMATLLVILCLINTVIYIASSPASFWMGRRDASKGQSAATHPHHPLTLAFLLLAILFELLGLVAILCRSRLLLLLYGVSMVVALVSLLFLLLRGSFGVLLTTVVNVFAIWRTYYFLVSGGGGGGGGSDESDRRGVSIKRSQKRRSRSRSTMTRNGDQNSRNSSGVFGRWSVNRNRAPGDEESPGIK
ncbi:hypothetical protein TYRP_010299 [Tyrophagus putrescentiae]|nr:hypothetical protein TYRP_010299 [Tyrophagus putrescentiae]